MNERRGQVMGLTDRLISLSAHPPTQLRRTPGRPYTTTHEKGKQSEAHSYQERNNRCTITRSSHELPELIKYEIDTYTCNTLLRTKNYPAKTTKISST